MLEYEPRQDGMITAGLKIIKQTTGEGRAVILIEPANGTGCATRPEFWWVAKYQLHYLCSELAVKRCDTIY